MMNEGFIQLSRELQNDPLFSYGKFDKCHAFVDLCFLAQFAERTFEIRGNIVKLLPGQLAKSLDELALRWGWSKHTVHKYIKELEQEGKIALQKSHVINVISVNFGLVTAPQNALQNAPQNANGGFTLNESGSTSSEWLGDKPMMPYALTPVNNTVLAANAYDHPDSQLITMKDGTAAPEKATKLTSGSRENYYDCMPTAICDMVTGDAIVYYIKSGRTSGDVFDIANPYTNDSVICYMIYNSEADTETKNGEEVTIPQGWLFKDFYNSEYDGDTASEEFLITNFGAQRFLDSPSFEGKDGEEFYSIPDFNAIAYNGFAVYAYSIDKDSSNDTYDDKEIML